MSYTDLPAEILTQIAQDFDVTSAISLAQTCSFSQQAAEGRIYETIHIQHIDRFAPPTQQRPITNGSIGDADDAVSERMYQPYIDTLLARPWRPAQVRSLIIEPQSPPPPELETLLKLVKDNLHHLRIMYPTGILVPNTSLEAVADLIGRTEMPVLRKIAVDVGGRWECLGALLNGSKGLKSLTVRGAEVAGAVTASAMSLGMGHHLNSSNECYQVIDTQTEVADVLQLEYLMIDRMDPGVVPLAVKIVNHSPKLSTVILRDQLVLWSPQIPAPSDDESPTPEEQGDPLLLALSSRNSITSLEIPSTSLVPMDRIISNSNTDGRFSDITDLTIAWEFPDLYACSGKRSPAHDAQDGTLIPTLPNLKTCIFTLRTHHCDPNAPPYSIYRGYIFDLSIKAIKREALYGGFESTPLLESIQLKDMYCPAPQEGSHPRCETMFDGAFITRYVGSGGNKLIHLRHRTAHSCSWEKYGVYNGMEVPKSCLDGVMSVNGTVGRNRQQITLRQAELNDEAWEVLRHWATLIYSG
jgi:hypothetical protein